MTSEYSGGQPTAASVLQLSDPVLGQTWLRLADGWLWALALARSFTTLRRIPVPS